MLRRLLTNSSRLVLTLFVALAFLTPLAVGAQVGGAVTTNTVVTLDGGAPGSLDTDGGVAWFRANPDDEIGDNAEDFLLIASRAEVLAITYQTVADVDVNGNDIVRQDSDPTNESYEFEHVEMRIDRQHATGEVRTLLEESAKILLSTHQEAFVYPRPRMAEDWDYQYFQTVAWNDDMEMYREIPEDRALYKTSDVSALINGQFSLFLHGADLTVRHAGGNATMEGYPVGVSESQDRINGDSQSWTDYVITLPKESVLLLQWSGNADVFVEECEVKGTEGFMLDVAWGELEVEPGKFVQLSGDPFVHRESYAATVQSFNDTGMPTTLWKFDSRPATASRVETPTGGIFAVGWGALSVIVIGTVLITGGGVSGIWGLRSLSNRGYRLRWPAAKTRSSTPVAIHDVPTAVVNADADVVVSQTKPTETVVELPKPSTNGVKPNIPSEALAPLVSYNRGIELSNQGRVDEALPHLQRGIAAFPDEPGGQYVLGVALARSGRIQDGLNHLEQAIRLDEAYLGLLVTDPETEMFRHHPDVARFVKDHARKFRDTHHSGYV